MIVGMRGRYVGCVSQLFIFVYSASTNGAGPWGFAQKTIRRRSSGGFLAEERQRHDAKFEPSFRRRACVHANNARRAHLAPLRASFSYGHLPRVTTTTAHELSTRLLLASSVSCIFSVFSRSGHPRSGPNLLFPIQLGCRPALVMAHRNLARPRNRIRNGQTC